jgi:hypothetical protein
MSLSKFNPRSLVLFVFILATGFLRILLHSSNEFSAVANFSPLGAMALFGGAYFTRSWKAIGFPLLSLFISDVVLSLTVFSSFRTGLLYGGWYWTYGAFALMALTGKFLLKKIAFLAVLSAALLCVLIHWIVTDFGVWLGSPVYPQTASGFIACLVAAIPFEWNFLAGTFFYSAVLFGAFEWMKKRNPQLQVSFK